MCKCMDCIRNVKSVLVQIHTCGVVTNCDAVNKLLLARRYYYVTLRFAEKGMWVN